MIMDILLDEDIVDAITEDGATTEDLLPNVFKERWLVLFADNTVIGVCCLHPKTSVACIAHINILKEYRKKHSKSAGAGILEWVKTNTRYKTITTEVPVIYTNVISFLISFDFIESGKIKNAFMKNDKLIDLIILSRSV
jgi:N-acetylglutamate synthase-like GNAT family acetyltransferase